jgi:hypothetical protein
MSSLVSDNVVGVLPDGAQVEVGKGSAGNDLVAIKSAVTGGALTITGNTAVTGKGFIGGTTSITAKAGETTTHAIQTTVYKNNAITNDGEGNLAVNVLTGKFKKSSITSKGVTNDGVSFASGVRVVKNTLDMKDGDDTVTFKSGSKVIGKNVVKFGEGTGKDSIEIENLDDVKGTVVVRNFGKNDTAVINGKSYNFKQALKFANNNDGITIRKD